MTARALSLSALSTLATSAPLVVALAALGACAHGHVDARTEDARTLRCPMGARDEASADAGADAPAIAMRATYYPPTHQTATRPTPVVVLEPLLFRRAILRDERGEGMIAHLEREGFPVWLVWVDAPVPPPARALGRGFAHAVEAIARAAALARVDVIGTSLGAPAVLDALEPLTRAGAPVTVRKVAFFAGGFDYAYPGSFAERVASIGGAPASSLCALDGGRACANQFRDERGAARWLGVIPPHEEGDARPAAERFPFVPRLRVPVLFLNGKGDGIAPSESMYSVFRAWGEEAFDGGAPPKRMVLAGRENGFDAELDHYALFRGDEAPRAWDLVVSWLRDDDP